MNAGAPSPPAEWRGQDLSCARCKHQTWETFSANWHTDVRRLITNYAQEESDRADLGITFTAVFPGLTPLTGLGEPAVKAYAARGGQSELEYLQQLPKPLTPEGAGAAVLELIRRDATELVPGYLLTGDGLGKIAPERRDAQRHQAVANAIARASPARDERSRPP